MAITVGDYLIDDTMHDRVEDPRTLPDLFAEAAAAWADAPAVSDGEHTRTWREWRAESHALAAGLQDLGVRPGDPVAVRLANSWEFLIAHVAIADLGAVMVPLHLALGPRELRSLLERVAPRFLVLPAEWRGRDELADARRISAGLAVPTRLLVTGEVTETPDVRSLTALSRAYAGRRPRPIPVRPEQPFVLLPSSGTTSTRPKLCLHSHAGLLANAATVAREGRFRADDTIVSASAFTHLFGLLSIHLSVLVGHRQALLPAWDVETFADLAARVDATVLFAVPAQLRDVVGRTGTHPPIRLREVRTGGAAVPGRLVDELRRVAGARTIVQWGMSELGAGTYTLPDDPPEVAARSIGRPIREARVRVLDESGAPCAPDEVGELQYRGPHLFRGYLGDPELTRAAMTADGWLRTGDRAALAEDGTVVFHGRHAESINVGGLKFGAAEVEAVLDELPQFAGVAIGARPDARLGEYPCVVAALRPGATIDLEGIRAHLARREVAEYKWPLVLIVVDEVPVTPTGKIARGRLAELLASRTDAASGGVRGGGAGDATGVGRRGTTHRDGVIPAVAESADPADSVNPAGPANLANPAIPADWADPANRADPANPVDPAAPATRALRSVAALTLVVDLTTDAVGAEPAEPVAPDATFGSLGLHSAAAVRLALRLSEAAGIPLPSTVVYDHPTPRALARHLAALGGEAEPDDRAVPRTAAGDDDEPLVIVGMGCRFPGGIVSPADLWRVLDEGRDTITEFPADRGWDATRLYHPDPDHPGTSYVRHGGFVADAADFDARFFGIGPGEALAMDPQQRLLLETTWEALERAGIDPATLRGTPTGVYVGMMAADYAPRVGEDPERFDGRLLTGNAASVASGRIAYQLGLTGPALTVDTACSSSLVALHLAGQALRRRECTLAVVGGVTVMAGPGSFVEFSRQRALAADGRCKAFAAAADGAGWAEGAGVLILERRSDARRLGHAVLAELRGSAVNQDGASNGLTAPHGGAQEQVIRRALADAGLSADQVDAVEAHGTGTPLGDPIEARAILAGYGGRRRAGAPLWLGSIKSNLGHTQAAAGIAGVIKTVLALRHGVLPRTLHVDAPTPHVDWSSDTVRLLTAAIPWPRSARPRIAGVSAFGISGTNAHVLVSEADEADDAPAARSAVPGGRPVPWVLSAKTPAALRELAGRVADHPTVRADRTPAAVGHTLARTRTGFEHRAVVVADEPAAYRAALRAFAAGEDTSDLVGGIAGPVGEAVFVFPGQGSQWAGMVDGLLSESPEFARSMAVCDAALAEHLHWSPLDVLRGVADGPPADGVEVVQAVLFATQVSLAELWRAYGVRPAAVVGHSQGEVAAAYVCGALSLADAARVVAVRGRVVRELAGGAMASVALSADELRSRAALRDGRVSIAAVNAPRSVVLAGDAPEVDALLAELRGEDVRVARLPVDYASHSAHVAEAEHRLRAELAGITPRAGHIPLYSTVDPGRLDTRRMDAEYWYRNLRRPVAFDTTVGKLLADGHRYFVEPSPHPLLTHAVHESAEAAGRDAVAVGSLRRGDGGMRRFLLSMADAYVQGVSVDWRSVCPGRARDVVELPTYPFRRERYWLPDRSTPATRTPATPSPAAPERPAAGDTAGIADRIRALPEAEGRIAVSDLVRRIAADVIGYPDADEIPADHAFQEHGFDSLAAARMRRRLTDLLGVRLPAGVVFDLPTPARLAAYVRSRLVDAAPAAIASPELPDGLAGLVRRACADGQAAVALDILASASRLRPVFDTAAASAHASIGGTRARGGTGPELVWLPSVLPMSGPHEYARLAAHWVGVRTVHVLSQPGFLAGEPLPRDLDALVAAHVAALERRDGSAPFVLCGHSSGGLIAHAVAGRLEALGRPAEGVILLDTSRPDPELLAAALPTILAAPAAGLGTDADPGTGTRPGTADPIDAGPTRLTATGAYLRILTARQPEPIGTPTLLLRAERPLAGAADWVLPHTRVDVPGDHFSVLDADAGPVVAAVESWLLRLPFDAADR
ncbi:type I polyketide synthase [Embleya hyalina]|uniref:Polyketide synthase n=1 Tax=Embleya hyalina TaxID=516124 RepID=A0A401Z0Z0_9ACTN|nr:type I polyketide synthase [Embleya hyalina]GCE00498.1 polyketide synthase [Embleya hyalina]